LNTLLGLTFFSLLGCPAPPDSITFSGTRLADYFPFDGERTWEFQNSDTSITYRLDATLLVDETVSENAVKRYTVSYTTDCASADKSCVDGEELRAVQWSSDNTNGVFIHSYRTGGLDMDGVPLEESTVFDPPIQVADFQGKRGDIVETVVDGVTWTSELVAFEDCPVQVSSQWTCALFRLEHDMEGDGYPIEGDYWAVTRYNVVAFDLVGDTGRWELRKTDCEGDCDGVW